MNDNQFKKNQKIDNIQRGKVNENIGRNVKIVQMCSFNQLGLIMNGKGSCETDLNKIIKASAKLCAWHSIEHSTVERK